LPPVRRERRSGLADFSCGIADPPSGQARRLLETTWQMAGGSLRWPVFAELDRRLYSGHDIDALDATQAMPFGFLWGIGPNEDTGRQFAAHCPHLAEPRHGSWHYAVQVSTVGGRDAIR
jgi:hypothetical protein